jgi:hypothetical protein
VAVGASGFVGALGLQVATMNHDVMLYIVFAIVLLYCFFGDRK